MVAFANSDQAAPVTAGMGAPGKPVVSDDNGWNNGLKDGNYNITMNLWYGNNGTIYKLYENGVLIDTKDLKDQTPNAQSVKETIQGKKNGEYKYYCELINAYGTTTSDAITVEVTQIIHLKNLCYQTITGMEMVIIW